MFNIEKFMAYMKETFGPMDNHFTYDTVENLVRYAMEHKSHTKDAVCFFLSDIIEELEFGEAAMFEDDVNLTNFGRAEKRDALKRRYPDTWDLKSCG